MGDLNAVHLSTRGQQLEPHCRGASLLALADLARHRSIWRLFLLVSGRSALQGSMRAEWQEQGSIEQRVRRLADSPV